MEGGDGLLLRLLVVVFSSSDDDDESLLSSFLNVIPSLLLKVMLVCHLVCPSFCCLDDFLLKKTLQ